MQKTINKLLRDSRELRKIRKETKEKFIKNALMENEQPFLEFFKYPKSLEHPLYLSTKWLYGGFIINIDKLAMLIDPGAELLSRMQEPSELLRINALFISHPHIDHYSSVNIALDFMSYRSARKNIKILASKDIFNQKLINNYFLTNNKLLTIEKVILSSGKILSLHGDKIKVVEMVHSIKNTFGFILYANNVKVGYIPDTGYSKSFKTDKNLSYKTGVGNYEGEFKEIMDKYLYIKESFKDIDVLVVNINDLFFNKHSKFHLTAYDLIDILKGTKIKLCILPNLFPKDLLNISHAEKLAEFISTESGVKTKAISNEGLRLYLEKL